MSEDRDLGCHLTNTVSASPAAMFVSTNLNHRITGYNKLAERIAMTLGWPQINIEVHSNQVFDNIAQGCELFTKFAGYTEEFIIFHAEKYEKGLGVPLDKLFSMTPHMSNTFTVPVTSAATDTTGSGIVSGGYDYDLQDYRKVVDVFSFEEGTTAGINTLFTIEQTLAQQTYFSYAMGKYGFDLISWYSLKQWLDTRKKLLSQEHYFTFNDRTQRLIITPDPNQQSAFWGAIGAYVERPIRDLIKEIWIYQYALALTKINLGRIRGKYSGTDLFGGGAPNTDVLEEGKTEKRELEERLYVGGTPGFGDAAPPQFFVG